MSEGRTCRAGLVDTLSPIELTLYSGDTPLALAPEVYDLLVELPAALRSTPLTNLLPWRTVTLSAKGLSPRCLPPNWSTRVMLHILRSGSPTTLMKVERSRVTLYSPVGDSCTSIFQCTNARRVGSNAGAGFIHKSKLNSNGSFSVGKTWKLTELRGIEVLNVSVMALLLVETQLLKLSAASGVQYNLVTPAPVAN